jgi:hypothetical protein
MLFIQLYARIGILPFYSQAESTSCIAALFHLDGMSVFNKLD